MAVRLGPLLLSSTLMVLASGCRFETTLDSSGGGTMRVEVRGTASDTLPKIKSHFTSDNVEITKATLDDRKVAVIELKYKDFRKLSASQEFSNIVFALTDDASAKTRTASATIKAAKSKAKLSAVEQEYFGKIVSVAITVPGEVVKTNGQTNDKTVTWAVPLDIVLTTESMFTVTFKNTAAVSGTPAGTIPAANATPAPSAKATPAHSKKKRK